MQSASDNALMSRSYNNKKTNLPKYRQLEQTFHLRSRGWQITLQNAVPHHELLGKWKWKPQWNSTAHLLEWLIQNKTLTIPSTREERQELSNTPGWNAECYSHFAKAVLVVGKTRLPYDPLYGHSTFLFIHSSVGHLNVFTF